MFYTIFIYTGFWKLIKKENIWCTADFTTSLQCGVSIVAPVIDTLVRCFFFCKMGYWMDNKHISYGRQPLLFILPLILIEDNDLNYCFSLIGSTLFSSKYLTWCETMPCPDIRHMFTSEPNLWHSSLRSAPSTRSRIHKHPPSSALITTSSAWTLAQSD